LLHGIHVLEIAPNHLQHSAAFWWSSAPLLKLCPRWTARSQSLVSIRSASASAEWHIMCRN